MKQSSLLIIVFLLLMGDIVLNAQPPKAPSQPVTETYFGKQITDPYRNLENLQDPAVQQWMKAQSDYAQAVLNSINGRQSLINMMEELLDKRNSAQVSNLAITNNDIYFYLKTNPGDETAKLYTRNGFEGSETLLFDPSGYSKDTTQKYVIATILGGIAIYPSDDGSLVVFGIAPNGSENTALMIMEVKNKKLCPEKIDRCFEPQVSWLPGNRGFLFNRLRSGDVHDKERLKNIKIYLHKVGTDPSTDKEFFSGTKYPGLRIKPEDVPEVRYDKDTHYIFAFTWTVDRRLNVFYAPASELNNSSIGWKRLFKPEDEAYDFNATDKELYILSGKNAPNFKILKTSLQNPDLSRTQVVIPEDSEGTITSFKLTNEGLYYTIAKNGVEAALHHLPKGAKKSTSLKLPFAAGNISLTTKGFKYPDVWASMVGWTSDSKRYLYLPGKNQFKLETISAPAEYPELADVTVEEVSVSSHDGVKVPLSLIYKRTLRKDGNNPVLMLGYGSYGVSINPAFSVALLSWARQGGVAAVAHVRGGGELGEKWHKGGYKITKPNTWKDFISCAEYLINNKYTAPQKLAIVGISAGGILIGRAMTERPDIFAAAIPDVGALNPLRLEETPSGPNNVPEFGSVKDSTECMALIEMDSYHHLKKGEKYPATLITAGMNDPRVIAWQPAKFAARLIEDNASDKPILFWTDYEAGHGIGEVKMKTIERWADFLSFALWQMGHPDFQIK